MVRTRFVRLVFSKLLFLVLRLLVFLIIFVHFLATLFTLLRKLPGHERD